MKLVILLFSIFHIFSCIEYAATPLETKNAGKPDVHGEREDSCTEITLQNPNDYGAPCINYLRSMVNNKTIKETPISFVAPNELQGVATFEPDKIGNNFHYYRAQLKNHQVFIKGLLGTEFLNIVEMKSFWRRDAERSYFKVFNEAYWAQKLAEEDLGPALYGVTFIDSGISKLLGLVSEFVDGVTYKVGDDPSLLSPYMTPAHRAAVERILPKLRAFIKKNHVTVQDLQYMVSPANKVWIIDPENWAFDNYVEQEPPYEKQDSGVSNIIVTANRENDRVVLDIQFAKSKKVLTENQLFYVLSDKHDPWSLKTLRQVAKAVRNEIRPTWGFAMTTTKDAKWSIILKPHTLIANGFPLDQPYNPNNAFQNIINGSEAARDARINKHTIAFTTTNTSPLRLVIPKGPYLSLYDFATHASAEEIADLFSMLVTEKVRLGLVSSEFTYSSTLANVPHCFLKIN